MEMEKVNELIKLAIDGHKGKVEQYSVADSQQTLREALIDLNGGSSKIDYRRIRDGKADGLFTLVETILGIAIEEGLRSDDFFMNYVDYYRVKDGDAPVFDIDDNDTFYVADAAIGTQGLRRQRAAGLSQVTIPTQLKAVRIYEELNRILAGLVDFNRLIDKVDEAYRRQMVNDIYTLWAGATTNTYDLSGNPVSFNNATFTATGTYDEATMLDLVAKVEATSGKQATILGTKVALRNLAPAVQGVESANDLYNLGYYGRFYSNPVVALPARWKAGGHTEFVFPDDIITVVAAGDDKPIKVVMEGDPLVIRHEPRENGDLTETYMFGQKYGVGLILTDGMGAARGIYDM